MYLNVRMPSKPDRPTIPSGDDEDGKIELVVAVMAIALVAITGWQASNRRKNSQQKTDKASFCTAVRQVLISLALPNSKKKKKHTLVCTYCSVSLSPEKHVCVDSHGHCYFDLKRASVTWF